ncbi:MAG: FHA domain-containing protein [Anaerolineales bacterium]|nr:FHA domain-containing protein [Anaerolineales bacterium]
MSDELFCSKHGPYPASYGTCPWCVAEMGGRPPAPQPLDAEATNRIPPQQWGGYADDDETVLPGGKLTRRIEGLGGVEDETLPPARGGGLLGGLDDETQLPERKRRRILDPDAPIEDDIDETVLDREETSLMGWLIVKRSPYLRRGHLIKIRSGAILGRNPKKADVVIDDDKVSSLHARIQVKENNFVLIDLGSANGTWVNGEELNGPRAIVQDDEIKLGDTVFVLKTL